MRNFSAGVYYLLVSLEERAFSTQVANLPILGSYAAPGDTKGCSRSKARPTEIEMS